MNVAHKKAKIALKAAESRYARRQREYAADPASKSAEKAYRAAKHELAFLVSEYRRTRPAASHTSNGDAQANPETFHITTTILDDTKG